MMSFVRDIFKRCMLALFFLMLLCFTSCESSKLPPVGEGEMVPLALGNPAIGPSLQVKGALSGSQFPNSQSAYPVGLWLMRDGSAVTPQIQGFANMKAELRIADGLYSWAYYPGGSAASNGVHILKAKPLDVRAYYPWKDGASDLTKIPFTSGEDDWMVANPVDLSEAETTGAVVVPLAFSHIMTCIEVSINLRYEGNVTLNSVVLSDSQGRLVASGTFNANTGEISGTQGASVSLPDLRRSLRSGYWTSVYFIMPEITGVAAGQLNIQFTFNNVPVEFTLPLDMKVGGQTQTIDAFKKGYKYTYRLTLDNTIDFVPVGFEEAWNTKEVLLPI